MNFSRIDYLKVQNYRALQDFEISDLTPLTVFLGPPQSGKTIVFDVFAFLSEAFKSGLRNAWDKRGGFSKLNPLGPGAPIVFEMRFREKEEAPATTYHLEIKENNGGPSVEEEWIQWRGTRYGASFRFVDLKHGKAMSRARLNVQDDRPFELITPADELSLSSLQQFSKHPRVIALRQFIDSWHFSHLGGDDANGISKYSADDNGDGGTKVAGSANANTIADLLCSLRKLPPWILDKVLRLLQLKMQSLEKIDSDLLQELRKLLSVKDADNNAMAESILNKLGSDVTLKMFSYLARLYHPDQLQPIIIELPENRQTAKLLSELASECRLATEHSQLIVTTHSPEFVNAIHLKELWTLSRDESGITHARRAAHTPGIDAYINDGVPLGELWMRGFFDHVPHGSGVDVPNRSESS